MQKKLQIKSINFYDVIEAWKNASIDLNIKIQTPFIITTSDKIEISYGLMVENFGKPKGTIIFSIYDMKNINIPEKYDYYCSALNPEVYSTYDRDVFIEVLNDWGYYGEKSETPEWYTGFLFTD